MVKFKQEEEKDFKSLNEAIKSYVKVLDKSSGNKRRKANFNYSDFFENKMLIIQSIRNGISYDLYSNFKEVAPFSESEWAKYLNLSLKSLQRYKNEVAFLFRPIHSEKIIELAEVYLFGKDVFDSNEQFNTWLNTPSYALGNLKPSDLLQDSYGKELVMDELNRIDQGIFA